MGGSPGPVVFCPARVKTQVLWSSFLFKTYHARFSLGNVTIDWERNADLPPWHTFGKHNTSAMFDAIVAGAYCNFWFTSPVDLTITWE